MNNEILAEILAPLISIIIIGKQLKIIIVVSGIKCVYTTNVIISKLATLLAIIVYYLPML